MIKQYGKLTVKHQVMFDITNLLYTIPVMKDESRYLKLLFKSDVHRLTAFLRIIVRLFNLSNLHFRTASPIQLTMALWTDITNNKDAKPSHELITFLSNIVRSIHLSGTVLDFIPDNFYFSRYSVMGYEVDQKTFGKRYVLAYNITKE